MRVLPLQSTAMHYAVARSDAVARGATRARPYHSAGLKACATRTTAAATAALIVAFAVTLAGADAPTVFRWAGDPEGGAPFVEADPSHPDVLVGFDVEIAELMARRLGRTPRFINIQFQSIDQSIARGDAEVGLSGIEDTPARRATLAVTV